MSPPFGIQSFSPVPLPVSPKVAERAVSTRQWVLLGALVSAALVLSAIAVLQFMAGKPARAPSITRVEAIKQGLARQRAVQPVEAQPEAQPSEAPAANRAPSRAAAPRASTAARPQAVAQPTVAAPAPSPAPPKPSAPVTRSPKFSDEPVDPN